jgi:gamma-resorcylate decarboxylase
LEGIEQISVDRVLFSVDSPYEQIDSGSRWFDDIRLDNQIKLKVGRENANRLFSLGLPTLSESSSRALRLEQPSAWNA